MLRVSTGHRVTEPIVIGHRSRARLALPHTETQQATGSMLRRTAEYRCPPVCISSPWGCRLRAGGGMQFVVRVDSVSQEVWRQDVGWVLRIPSQTRTGRVYSQAKGPAFELLHAPMPEVEDDPAASPISSMSDSRGPCVLRAFAAASSSVSSLLRGALHQTI